MFTMQQLVLIVSAYNTADDVEYESNEYDLGGVAGPRKSTWLELCEYVTTAISNGQVCIIGTALYLA